MLRALNVADVQNHRSSPVKWEYVEVMFYSATRNQCKGIQCSLYICRRFGSGRSGKTKVERFRTYSKWWKLRTNFLMDMGEWTSQVQILPPTPKKMPLWWKFGRHRGLKIPRWIRHAGSIPVSGTNASHWTSIKRFSSLTFLLCSA